MSKVTEVNIIFLYLSMKYYLFDFAGLLFVLLQNQYNLSTCHEVIVRSTGYVWYIIIVHNNRLSVVIIAIREVVPQKSDARTVDCAMICLTNDFYW